MRLRFKFSKTQNFILNFDDAATFEELEQKVSQFLESTYKSSGNFILSLNGVDCIEGVSSSSLESLGIVSGDLIKILSPKSIDNKPTASSNVKRVNIQNPSNTAGEKITAKKKKTMIFSTISMLEAKENTLPKLIEDYFERFEPQNLAEATNLLVHITMLECGFNLDVATSDDLYLPPSWRKKAATLDYHNLSFGEFKCTLVLVTMGDIKQISVCFDDQDKEISMRLDMRDYIISNELLPYGLKKISQMSMLLRNNLLLPLQIAAHEMLGVVAPWHLVGLPIEILLHICKYLDVSSVLSLGGTCVRLNHVMKNDRLWLNMLKRDFKQVTSSTSFNWKNKYKELYVEKKRNEEKSNFYEYPEQPMPMPGTFPYNPTQPPNPFRPSPFADPDSPYFGGEIPCTPDHPLYPHLGDPMGPLGPLGAPGPFGPLPSMRGGFPLPPHLGSRAPRRPRGPRFDFI